MKKMLASALCAVLLLGMLPNVTPPASMASGIMVEADVYSTYVGDTVTWRTFGTFVHSGPVTMFFYYFENRTLYSTQGFPLNTVNVTTQTQPHLPGSYFTQIQATDSLPGQYTAFSAPVIVTLRPAPKNVKAGAVSATTLKVSWKAVPGANGYEVWRSLAKAGPYSMVKTTAATSWSDTSLASGKLYWYKIRSTNLVTLPLNMGSVPSGHFSAPVAGVPLAKSAVISAAGVSSSQIKLAWAKVAGATGYQVFRSATAGGTYSSIKLTTALSYTAGGMLHAKTYYFKVRAYKQFGTVRYYGPLSVYKAGKTK